MVDIGKQEVDAILKEVLDIRCLAWHITGRSDQELLSLRSMSPLYRKAASEDKLRTEQDRGNRT